MPGCHSATVLQYHSTTVPQCHSTTTMPGCHSGHTQTCPKGGGERTNQLECGKSGRNQTMIFSLDSIAWNRTCIYFSCLFIPAKESENVWEMSTFCEPCAPDCGEKGLICFYLLLRRLSLGRLMYKTQGTVEKSRYTMKKSTVEKSTLEKNTSKVEKSMSTMEKRAHLLLSSAATALVWLRKTHPAYLPSYCVF